MPIAVIYIAAGVLFVGAAHGYLPYLPYGYYTVLKIVATGVFIGAFLVSFYRDVSLLPWIYLLLAITFNPIIKIPLPSELWMIVDIVAGALLIFTQNKIRQQSATKII
jgi:hypothetical protein